MGDAFVAEQPPDQLRVDRPQAHVRARRRRHRPREAPAVAVEHRQRPQVDRMVAELGLDHLAERVQVRPAVRVDNALRTSRRARRVVDRDRLLLVAQQRGNARRVAGGDQPLVLVTQPHDLEALPALAQQRLELAVDEQHPGSGVLEDVADLFGAQPHVDRHEHATGRRHGVVELQQLGHVRDTAPPRDRGAPGPARAAPRRAGSRARAARAYVRRTSPSTTATRSGWIVARPIQERRGIELGAADAGTRRPRGPCAVGLAGHGATLQAYRRRP